MPDNHSAGMKEPLAQYLVHLAIGTSDIIAAMRSPAHYRSKIWVRSTEAMALGTAVHAAILEPERFAATYVVAPDMDRRTRDYKLWVQENVHDGSIALSSADGIAIDAMVAAVNGHALAASLVRGADIEASLYWNDPATAMPCKSRPDCLRAQEQTIVDLKTATDASFLAFQRSIHSYGYHIQAAHALNGAERVYGGGRWSAYLWVVVEKDPPYGVAVYQPDDMTLDAARYECQTAIELIAQCQEKGAFPGYPEEIQTIGLPAWAE